MKRRFFFTLPICAFIPRATHSLGASPHEPVRPTEKPEGHQDGQQSRQHEGAEKVTGIGGFFFRAHDPKALALWYQEHLGIALTPAGPGQEPWVQEAGPTAFTPFPETTKYLGEPKQVWMINFRVRNIDAMVKQLRAAGITVEDPKDYPPIGLFTRLHDPEGNPIELWQPAG